MMGSEAETASTGTAPANTAAPAAAGGGSMTMIIVAVVVVVVVVAAVLGYVIMSGDSDLELSGQWTVSGGTMKMTMVMNNDTSTKQWINETIPADSEIIDFDDPTTTPDGWDINDLGGGNFEIVNFVMADANFGTVTGHYDINGDTMTITMNGSGHVIDGTDYMEITFDYNVNFAEA